MTSTAANPAISTAIWPGCEPRLLHQTPEGAEDGAGYLAAGGYRELGDPEEFLAEVKRSGLLGRGGAAFPLAVKLASVRESAVRRGLEAVVIANGEEGEPASVKDRWLLRNRPHLVLDGLRLAAATVGATRGYVYVSDPASAATVEAALNEISPTKAFGELVVSVYTVAPGYVAGEETAAIRAINGGPAKPTDKPPRPYQKGVAQRPTLVSNVETLANLPYLLRQGATAFRSVGTESSPGTFLATVSGGGRPPVLYELPHGTVLADLLDVHGIPTDQVRGVLMGGYFAGVFNAEVLEVTLDHETLRAGGSGLGCGAMSVLTDDCPVAVAASVLAYFGRENAGQCGSCFNGTAAMAAVAEALRDQVATTEDVARLQRWAGVLPGRGACGTLDGATNVAASFLTQFPELVTTHLAGACDTCRGGAFRAERPYAIEEVPA
ncbi:MULTISPECIES: NADH-ubiquinone oxidoreductase-F iron-sulfur binding region domain-containing protein [Mycolicibacter]|uniref:NADH-ubiquinone oxidoreductase-F iron-sulfur binding region domain-containing protein n=1 Tax=[Mycobacterium] vasticus TaxID=2875777 RepID=A0ABU5YST4_9MYCO|nr:MULTISPECIES: NADH-ubiquinone oxidoreductase-F iron-sulfur binding region domain-containing protein [unclassified Mycolicibacter]MEB3061850.1 NADH-ubiquinone oxidoreductase-F iron-sulfur binding region domain-containing protein [Mycolicibacter sp. MYC101]MEB3068170.1 NADH-ubiquinone oxidoreductase-F iron-sulfur binding region domain-containing protein [Mycolicibacter sp. MYC017]